MMFAGSMRHLSRISAELARRAGRRLSAAGRAGFALAGPAPDRMLIVPPDLAPGDPAIAQEIYSGVFQFAGRHVNTGGGNPFAISRPDDVWRRELNAFGWLRHLSAAGGALMNKNAQALLRDWMEAHGRQRGGPAWEAEVAARRLIAWCCHSPLILENADIRFYRQFMKAFGMHVRFLRGAAHGATGGAPRLLTRIALAYASVCATATRPAQAAANRSLGEELSRQIRGDGGHVSRNPSLLPDFVALLLPLRQSYARLAIAPSPGISAAIDRMMGAIRFCRMGDGNFARFNGVSVTQRNLVLSILRFDEAAAMPPGDAPDSGYLRLAAGDTLVLVDAGAPPKGEWSLQAHAGCLSFEMSSGTSPLIVNCGAPTIPQAQANRLCRTTAAHSTATLNDTSSCRFGGGGLLGGLLAGRIVSGPRQPRVRRDQDEAGLVVTASHDGYVRPFDLVHHRTLRLSHSGNRLDGLDRFLRPNGQPRWRKSLDKAAIRFHLHPSVSAGRARDSGDIVLSANGGVRWIFQCAAVSPAVEESIFFAGSGGPRRSSQIVLHFRVSELHEVSWALLRAL
jgi:uncharacterized heparinase superfamily protein